MFIATLTKITTFSKKHNPHSVQLFKKYYIIVSKNCKL